MINEPLPEYWRQALDVEQDIDTYSNLELRVISGCLLMCIEPELKSLGREMLEVLKSRQLSSNTDGLVGKASG